jgi:hypothetical protein
MDKAEWIVIHSFVSLLLLPIPSHLKPSSPSLIPSSDCSYPLLQFSRLIPLYPVSIHRYLISISLTQWLTQSVYLSAWLALSLWFISACLTMLICLLICPPICLCVCLRARSLLNVPQLMKKGEAEQKGRKMVKLNLLVTSLSSPWEMRGESSWGRQPQ